VLSLTVIAVVFGVIFLAELPDKTALAGLMLGTRYRASYVFAGVAAAFAVHVALAIAAGSLLTLLPHRWVQGVVGLLFLGGAAMLLLSKGDDDETVNRSGIWRATCSCMVENPYQRCTSGFRHQRAAATSSTRSRVMGWCTVATTGIPEPAMVSSPVPRL